MLGSNSCGQRPQPLIPGLFQLGYGCHQFKIMMGGSQSKESVDGLKLYIGNLPFGTTDQEFQDHFSSRSTVSSAKVMINRFTGRSRGFGFVEMFTQEEAEQAIIPLYETDLGGRILGVNEARPPEE